MRQDSHRRTRPAYENIKQTRLPNLESFFKAWDYFLGNAFRESNETRRILARGMDEKFRQCLSAVDMDRKIFAE